MENSEQTGRGGDARAREDNRQQTSPGRKALSVRLKYFSEQMMFMAVPTLSGIAILNMGGLGEKGLQETFEPIWSIAAFACVCFIASKIAWLCSDYPKTTHVQFVALFSHIAVLFQTVMSHLFHLVTQRQVEAATAVFVIALGTMIVSCVVAAKRAENALSELTDDEDKELENSLELYSGVTFLAYSGLIGRLYSHLTVQNPPLDSTVTAQSFLLATTLAGLWCMLQSAVPTVPQLTAKLQLFNLALVILISMPIFTVAWEAAGVSAITILYPLVLVANAAAEPATKPVSFSFSNALFTCLIAVSNYQPPAELKGSKSLLIILNSSTLILLLFWRVADQWSSRALPLMITKILRCFSLISLEERKS